jgi:hypothetical protein
MLSIALAKRNMMNSYIYDIEKELEKIYDKNNKKVINKKNIFSIIYLSKFKKSIFKYK